jgi:hypothetical protein
LSVYPPRTSADNVRFVRLCPAVHFSRLNKATFDLVRHNGINDRVTGTAYAGLMGRASAEKSLSKKSEAVAKFLRDTLASGPVCVPKLEELCRVAGHLGERQPLSQSKAFRAAKESLGVRSVRAGFGSGGEWFWQLPTQGASASPNPAGQLPAGSKQEAPAKPRIPSEWVEGVGRLEYQSPPSDVPLHRWRLFLTDHLTAVVNTFADRRSHR